MRLQILPKLDILRGNGILPNMRQQKQRQSRTEDTQSGADEKRILTATNAVCAAGSVGLDDWEDVGSDKGANLAERGCDGVVLPADGRGAGFGGYEADVVAWASFAKGEKNSVDDDEASDVSRGIETAVDTGHDEADNALEEDIGGEGVTRPYHITQERAADCAGEVEQIYDGIPTESLP